MESNKKTSELPELNNWLDIDKFMMEKKEFLFKGSEVILWLPIGANKYLQKAIKYSHKTAIFAIQEDEYNEKDWSIITKGLIARKNSSTNLKISFTKLHKSNLPFIRDILRKANISEITCHDCMIEEGCFDSFCDAISNATAQLNKISITKNELTNEQIKKIERTVSSVGKQLMWYNSEIRSLTNQSELYSVNHYSDRYKFEWMHELLLKEEWLESVNIEDPRLCFAVKMSPCLNTIKIGAINYSWKWMTKAIIANKNIQCIKVDSSKRGYSDALREIFLKKNNITTLEIMHAMSGNPEQIISNSRSVKHLIVGSLDNEQANPILNAIKEHESLTALTIISDHIVSNQITSNQLVALLRDNPRISSLTVIQGIIRTNSQILKDIFFDSLKELHLFSVEIDSTIDFGEVTEQHLFEAVSNSKTLQAFSYRYRHPNVDVSVLKNILHNNLTLTKINLMNVKFETEDQSILLEGLKNHPNLTSFGFDLDPECAVMFADILSQNTRLNHIGISINPNLLEEDQLSALKSAIDHNTHLRSISIETNAKESPFAFRLFGESPSITSFEYRVEYRWDYPDRFVQAATRVLERNYTLTSITIVEQYTSIQVDVAIQELLKRNKDLKYINTSKIMYFIGIMAARPELYLSILPLEIWSNIFKRISFPGVHLDFDKLLLERFDKS